MLKLRTKLDNEKSIYLRVKINPNAQENNLKEILSDGTYKINIVAPAIKNKANKELISFIAKNLDIPVKNVTILIGKTCRVKLLRLNNNI